MNVANLAGKLAFLRDRETVRLRHSTGTLFAHLLGTRELLVKWGCRQALCDAGLFHSVYGTESYPTAAIPQRGRSQVRAVIGTEAERLAFLFGIMEKRSFYTNLPSRETYSLVARTSGTIFDISSADFADLSHLVTANWLEQRPRVPIEYRFWRREELSAMRTWLLPPAWKALNAIYEFDS